VIGVVVNTYFIRIPVPVVTVPNVIWSYGKVEAVEPEAVGTSATKSPDMTATEASSEAAMFIGVVEMVTPIASARVMANPLSVGVYVRSLRMALPVIVMAVFLNRTRVSSSRRTMSRNVLVAAADFGATSAMFLMLGNG
jgi:hypothetical protein